MTWTRSPTPPADAPVPCKKNKNCCAPSSNTALFLCASNRTLFIQESIADEVFAPRQQREQLEPEIGNKESSECDRWNAHKRIPDHGRHTGMNGVEYDDVRQVHAITHARKVVYQSPQEAVAAIRMNVSEEQEESRGHDRNV